MNIHSKQQFNELTHRQRSLYVAWLADDKHVRYHDMKLYGVPGFFEINNYIRLSQLWEHLPESWRLDLDEPVRYTGGASKIGLRHVQHASAAIIRYEGWKFPYKAKLTRIPKPVLDIMVKASKLHWSASVLKAELCRLCGVKGPSEKVDSAANSSSKMIVHVGLCKQILKYIRGKWQRLYKTTGSSEFVAVTLPGADWGFEIKLIAEIDLCQDIQYKPTLTLYGVENSKKVLKRAIINKDRPRCAFMAHSKFEDFFNTDYHLTNYGQCLSKRRPRAMPMKCDFVWFDPFSAFSVDLVKSFAVVIRDSVDQGYAALTMSICTRGRKGVAGFFESVAAYTDARDFAEAVRAVVIAVIRETTDKDVVLTYSLEYQGGDGYKSHMITLGYAIGLDEVPSSAYIKDIRPSESEHNWRRPTNLSKSWTYIPPDKKGWSKTTLSGVTGEL